MKKLYGVEEIASLTRQELSDFVIEGAKSETFDNNWRGTCLICSWVLNQVLRSYGIKSELCIGRYDGISHAFTMVKDHVVDITATQFEKSEVVIEPLYSSNYIIEHKGQAARLKMKEWPYEQQPRTYRKKLGNIIRRLNQQGAGDHVKQRIGESKKGE